MHTNEPAETLGQAAWSPGWEGGAGPRKKHFWSGHLPLKLHTQSFRKPHQVNCLHSTSKPCHPSDLPTPTVSIVTAEAQPHINPRRKGPENGCGLVTLSFCECQSYEALSAITSQDHCHKHHHAAGNCGIRPQKSPAHNPTTASIPPSQPPRSPATQPSLLPAHSLPPATLAHHFLSSQST